MAGQPTGTVTMLFTDIEGSTRLLQELGRERYAEALELHRGLLREAFERRQGYEVDCEGDAFFVAFASAQEAVVAAAEAQQALAQAESPDVQSIRVRMGLHTGEPIAAPPKYVGLDVHKAARIMAAAHGGQVLVSAATRALLDPAVALRDLGDHRLKDLTAPERIYQLGDGCFPPLTSLHQTNLPVQATPLVGRARELAEIVDLVRAHRLVTLTGTGGSGKTRLALQAAAELAADFRDGVWFVSLAALTDAALVESTIGSLLGAHGALADFLRGKELLLVLDNLEHLLPDVAPLVARLDATVIATSRERLNVYGEQEYDVPPLPLDEAVALFTERARLLKAGFEPDEHVAAIARRLDGLPLALELAAARIKVLTPQQIGERLAQSLDLLMHGARDAPQRQRTLRATIDWSHELLTNVEQRAFAQLSVFAGSFSLDAATTVCDIDIDTLESLVDKSLVRKTAEGRFFLLETIRQYGLVRLVETDCENAVRRNHLTYFADLAERIKPLGEKDDPGALNELEHDRENFRAGLTYALETGQAELALRLGVALASFWMTRSYSVDARRWRADAFPLHVTAGAALRARALKTAAIFAFFVENAPREAKPLLKEALRLVQELGDDRERANLLHFFGSVARADGDVEDAIRYREQSLAIFRELGDRRGEATVLHLLGETYRDSGDLDRGEALLEEAVRIARAADASFQAVNSIHSLADLALDRRDLDRARERYLQALEYTVEVGARRHTAYCLAGLACVAFCRGDVEDAAVLWGASEQLEESLGIRMLSFERGRYECIVGMLSGSDAWQRGRALPFEEALSRARSQSLVA